MEPIGQPLTPPKTVPSHTTILTESTCQCPTKRRQDAWFLSTVFCLQHAAGVSTNNCPCTCLSCIPPLASLLNPPLVPVYPKHPHYLQHPQLASVPRAEHTRKGNAVRPPERPTQTLQGWRKRRAPVRGETKAQTVKKKLPPPSPTKKTAGLKGEVWRQESRASVSKPMLTTCWLTQRRHHQPHPSHIPEGSV